jgi:hypothetical protein
VGTNKFGFTPDFVSAREVGTEFGLEDDLKAGAALEERAPAPALLTHNIRVGLV